MRRRGFGDEAAVRRRFDGSVRRAGARPLPPLDRAGLPVQKLDGVNQMKLESDYLRHPLVGDMADMETISISHDSYNLLKFHGSYQQDDREKRKKGQEKAWQFMLRLKVPSGECPGPLYKVLDDLCEHYGQQDLRMTTRQAFQIHGAAPASSQRGPRGSSAARVRGEGCDVEIPSRRVAATPRPRRGESAEASRGDAAAATRRFRRGESRRPPRGSFAETRSS